MSRKKSKKKEEVIENMTEEILEVNEVEESTEPVEEVLEEPVEEVEEILEEPVEEVEEVLEEPVEEVVRQGKVTAEKLNVRQEPNASASILLVVNKNDVYKIIDEVDDYYYLQINDHIFGYCKKDFIKECE